MGGQITLNPASTSDSTGWVNTGGAASFDAALADALDTTYATDTSAPPVGYTTVLRVGLSGTALPDGAAVKQITPTFRASQAAGSTQLACSVRDTKGYSTSSAQATYYSPDTNITPTSTIKDFVTGASGQLNLYDSSGTTLFQTNKTQQTVNNLEAWVYQAGATGNADDHRVYKVSAALQYVDAPTPGAVSLVDANDLTKTTRPRFKWAYSSQDSIPQNEYMAIVWALADVQAYPGGQAAFESSPANVFPAPRFSAPSFTASDSTTRTAKAWTVAPANEQYRSTSAVAWTQSATSEWDLAQDLGGSGDYIVYVMVAGQYGGSRLAKTPSSGTGAYSKLQFTMNNTPPAPPTSVTASWDKSKYRTVVTVSAPAITSLNGFTGRKIYVEHSLDGQAWYPLPVGMVSIPTDLTAATKTFYDTLTVPGRAHYYRAKVALYDSTYESPSSWAQAAGTVTADIDKFVLRDPLDTESCVVVPVQGDLQRSSTEVVGEFRALGSDRSVFVSDALGGYAIQLEVMTRDAAASRALQALRGLRRTLVLQTDMLSEWYWVRFGADASRSTLRQIGRVAEATRAESHTLELRETTPVAGQPKTWT